MRAMRPWHRALAALLLLAVTTVTLLRTLRPPNDWTEAHWLLDYRFGFVKRALPGQVLAWLADLAGTPVGAGTIAAAAFVVTGVFAALLLAVGARVLRRGGWSPAMVATAAVFLASPFLVLTGHLVGYYEQLFLALLIVAIAAVLHGRWWAGAALLAVTPFVHESALLLAYPAFGLAWLQQAARADAPAGRPPAWVALLLPTAAAIAIVVAVRCPPGGFVEAFNDHLRAYPFVAGGFETNTAPMLVMPSEHAFALVMTQFGPRMSQPSSFGVVMPTLLVLVAALAQRARLPLLSLEAVLVAAVVLLPQAMHLVAWDLERIWTYSLVTAWLALWIVVETRPPADDGGRGLLPIALLALAANFVVEPPLLDYEHERLPRVWRATAGLASLLVLLGLAAAAAPTPWRERLRIQGRELTALWRRSQR